MIEIQLFKGIQHINIEKGRREFLDSKDFEHEIIMV